MTLPASPATALAVTAQDTFARMLRTQIAPALRNAGFHGSGNRFHLPVPGWHARLQFQKSRTSDRDEVTFTVNVLVVATERWHRLRQDRAAVRGFVTLPEVPNAAVPYAGVWQSRLGHLTPTGGDQWHSVFAGMDTTALAAYLVQDIVTSAVPAMRAEMATTVKEATAATEKVPAVTD